MWWFKLYSFKASNILENVFATCALVTDLRNRDIVTRPIGDNRTLGVANAMTDAKSLTKDRGTFDYRRD